MYTFLGLASFRLSFVQRIMHVIPLILAPFAINFWSLLAFKIDWISWLAHQILYVLLKSTFLWEISFYLVHHVLYILYIVFFLLSFLNLNLCSCFANQPVDIFFFKSFLNFTSHITSDQRFIFCYFYPNYGYTALKVLYAAFLLWCFVYLLRLI